MVKEYSGLANDCLKHFAYEFDKIYGTNDPVYNIQYCAKKTQRPYKQKVTSSGEMKKFFFQYLWNVVSAF